MGSECIPLSPLHSWLPPSYFLVDREKQEDQRQNPFLSQQEIPQESPDLQNNKIVQEPVGFSGTGPWHVCKHSCMHI